MERAVEFNHFLSSYYPDTSYGADRHYADTVSYTHLTLPTIVDV